MRIISGSHKGRIIRPPRGLPIRPTTDLSKESLFNILVNHFDLEDCAVLDLFSGGGSISLEFASRSTQSICAVDKYPGCVKFLRSEANKLGMTQIEAIKMDVMAFLRNTYHTYDIIFCDPPYAWNLYREMIGLVFQRRLLKAGGWAIVEHHSVTKLNDIAQCFDTRAYGQNIMSFFRIEDGE